MFSSEDTRDRHSARRHRVALLGSIGLLFVSSYVLASDHADPIDLTRLKPLEPVITDLFVFPVDEYGAVANRFVREDKISLEAPLLKERDKLSYEQRETIRSLVVILCVRRALTKSGSLNLEPYTYRVHMDTRSKVSFGNTQIDDAKAEAAQGMGYAPAAETKGRPTGQEARARYGGMVDHSENITDDVVIEISLNNDTSVRMFDVRGLINPATVVKSKFESYNAKEFDADRFQILTGIRDDPFIFPAFFGTNVVAMAINIPIDYFPKDQQDWLIWGTSHKGRKQIDHVGRSLRTQNPRFELLNTLPPSQHVAAITEEHEHPSLRRDLALRFNIQGLFAYREWDRVPDVMIYSNRYPVGFPNGRVPEDDVAAILAQHGDTLLLELSHHGAQWPRRITNDKAFSSSFPFLAEPWPDREPPEQPHLSTKNTLILVFFAIVIVVILVLAALQLVQIFLRLLHWLLEFKPRRDCAV